MKELLERKARISKGIDFWLDELEDQLEPDNEEAHNALDNLKDYITKYDLYVDDVEAVFDQPREVTVHDRKPAA